MKNNKFILGMLALSFAAAPLMHDFKSRIDSNRSPASIYEVDLLRFDSLEQSKNYFESVGKDISKLKQIKKDIIESKESAKDKLSGLKEVEEQTAKIYKNIEKAMLKDTPLPKGDRDELKEIKIGLHKDLDALNVKEVVSSLEKEIPEESECKKEENPIEKLAHQFDKFLGENQSIISLFNTPKKSIMNQQQVAFANPNNIFLQMQLQASIPMNPYNFMSFNPLYSFFMNQGLSQFMSYAAKTNPIMGMQQQVDIVANDMGLTRIIASQKREAQIVESFNIIK